jgi:hypothetical protein
MAFGAKKPEGLAVMIAMGFIPWIAAPHNSEALKGRHTSRVPFPRQDRWDETAGSVPRFERQTRLMSEFVHHLREPLSFSRPSRKSVIPGLSGGPNRVRKVGRF